MNGYIDERLHAAEAHCPRKQIIKWHSIHCACDECLEADAYVCTGMPLSYIEPPVSIKGLEE